MSKYKLVKKDDKDYNQFKVTIKADSNDADYITSINFYSKKDFDDYVADGIIHLLEHGSGYHELEDYNNEYDLNIPYNGWDGFCHTLSYVRVEYVDENGITWDVEFTD